MAFLCVNIDHIATLRQARGEEEPRPLEAAQRVERAGAQGITVHLREDRRHIQDRDLWDLRRSIKTKLNLEMAATREMVRIALRIKPDQVTLVPEKRMELTTEGGLLLKKNPGRFENAIDRLQGKGIPVSLFIEPDPETILLSARLGATFIELHTGQYSRSCLGKADSGRSLRLAGLVQREYLRLVTGAKLAREKGLKVHAGHGLTYQNTPPIAVLPEIEDLNIGHNLIARACMVGLEKAVSEMLAVIRKTK